MENTVPQEFRSLLAPFIQKLQSLEKRSMNLEKQLKDFKYTSKLPSRPKTASLAAPKPKIHPFKPNNDVLPQRQWCPETCRKKRFIPLYLDLKVDKHDENQPKTSKKPPLPTFTKPIKQKLDTNSVDSGTQDKLKHLIQNSEKENVEKSDEIELNLLEDKSPKIESVNQLNKGNTEDQKQLKHISIAQEASNFTEELFVNSKGFCGS